MICLTELKSFFFFFLQVLPGFWMVYQYMTCLTKEFMNSGVILGYLVKMGIEKLTGTLKWTERGGL